MNLQSLVATTAWLAASAPAHARFRRGLGSPGRVQAALLRNYLRRGAATAYGRAHGLERCHNYADFCRRVPIVEHDALAPWIDRIRTGEPAVLTPDPVVRLLPTSGSTRARKLIPFTATLQSEFNAAIGPWISDLCWKAPAIAGGSAYWSVTPMGAANEERSSVPIGFADDSDYLGGTRARWVEAAMAVPSSVRHIAEVEAFRYTVLLFLLRRPDLRLISIWHPSFLTRLLEALRDHWEELLEDLAAGTCGVAEFIPGELRAALARPLDAKNLARLRCADPTRPGSVWPALRLVSCWADGHAAGPADELRRRLPGTTLQPKGLLATEAFISLPFAGAHPAAICSHFFEFIDERGAVRPLDALRRDETYEVIVTTGGGLWRYRLGDRVDVTGFIGKTPSLRFLGRAGNFSDRCGEKLSEAFVAAAIQRASGERPPTFALLAPEADELAGWRYVLYIEGSSAPELGPRLDALLCENPHYALCRRLGQLGAPRTEEIAANGYEIYAAAETARGLRLGDIKPAALSLRTDWSRWFPASSRATTSRPT